MERNKATFIEATLKVLFNTIHFFFFFCGSLYLNVNKSLNMQNLDCSSISYSTGSVQEEPPGFFFTLGTIWLSRSREMGWLF